MPVARGGLWDLADPRNFASPEQQGTFLEEFGLTPETAGDLDVWNAGSFARPEDQAYFLSRYGVDRAAPVAEEEQPTVVDASTENVAHENFEEPGAFRTFIYSPYNLPGSDEAAVAARGMQNTAYAGLRDLLTQDDSAERSRIADAIYGAGSEDINRRAGDYSRDTLENTFGRGVGLSSISGDALARIERERAKALGTLRNEAYTTAGAEVRGNRASRLNALDAAMNAGLSGLNLEASAGFTNAGRRQAAGESATGTAVGNYRQRRGLESGESQFGRELGSREDLYGRGLENTRDIANNQLIAGGISGGITGLSSLLPRGAGGGVDWGTISNWASRLFGGS